MSVREHLQHPAALSATMATQQTDSGNRLAPSQATVGPMCDIALDLLEEHSPIVSTDCIFDVGCGKGAFLLHAARRTPCEQLVGIEYDPHLVSVARRAAADAGYGGEATEVAAEKEGSSSSVECVPAMDPSQGRVRILLADALKADLSAATIIFLYLVPEGMKLLAPRIIPLLRAGKARVVTNAFSLPGCEAVSCVTYKYMKVRLYTSASVPMDASVGGASPEIASLAQEGERCAEAPNAGSTAPASDEVPAEQLQQFLATARAASAAASAEVL